MLRYMRLSHKLCNYLCVCMLVGVGVYFLGLMNFSDSDESLYCYNVANFKSWRHIIFIYGSAATPVGILQNSHDLNLVSVVIINIDYSPSIGVLTVLQCFSSISHIS